MSVLVRPTGVCMSVRMSVCMSAQRDGRAVNTSCRCAHSGCVLRARRRFASRTPLRATPQDDR